MPIQETPFRFEPALLEPVPSRIADLIAELGMETTRLGRALHPKTAASLADLVRIMNAYYSNLIEGNNTLPRDIERAFVGDLEGDERRRNLQLEAKSHVEVQRVVDRLAAEGRLPDPASTDFIKQLHRDFYANAPDDWLLVGTDERRIAMEPGAWRSRIEHDVVVGRHVPPSSERVDDFMRAFADRYRFDRLGQAGRIMAMAAAHHRFNYIHPFPDGNGRVSRLMSHAMAHVAGIGAHGLWSISRGLARGLAGPGEYKSMMDAADMPRQGDRDGRGNLSEKALVEFVAWFLSVALDQVRFMTTLFALDTLAGRLRRFADVEGHKPEAARILEDVLTRGEVERGEVERITRLPERSARRVLADLEKVGILASDTPKGPVSLRFPTSSLDVLFPRLFLAS